MYRIVTYAHAMYKWFVNTMVEWVFEIAITMTLALILFYIVITPVFLNMKIYERSVLVDWNGKSGALSVLEDGSKAYLEVQVLDDMGKTFEFKGTVYEVDYVQGDRIYLKRRKKKQ